MILRLCESVPAIQWLNGATWEVAFANWNLSSASGG